MTDAETARFRHLRRRMLDQSAGGQEDVVRLAYRRAFKRTGLYLERLPDDVLYRLLAKTDELDALQHLSLRAVLYVFDMELQLVAHLVNPAAAVAEDQPVNRRGKRKRRQKGEDAD